MSTRQDEDKVKEKEFQEKSWVLASDDNFYLARKSSQNCDEKIYVRGDKIVCGNFVIPPKKRLGRISAHPADETYYVLRGTLKVDLPRLGQIHEVKTGQIFYMPGGMIHVPFNDGTEECEVLWHCAPEWP